MGSPNGGTRVGTQFGPYELQALIGEGGMGEVYRAYDTVRERLVAIKVLRTEVAADQGFQQRFRRESRVAARLQDMTKSLACEAVVSDEVRATAGVAADALPQHDVEIRGRNEPMIVRAVADARKLPALVNEEQSAAA